MKTLIILMLLCSSAWASEIVFTDCSKTPEKCHLDMFKCPLDVKYSIFLTSCNGIETKIANGIVIEKDTIPDLQKEVKDLEWKVQVLSVMVRHLMDEENYANSVMDKK